MRKKFSWLTALFMVGLALTLLVSGCKNEEEENYKKGVKDQIDMVEKQVNEIEQHQANMRKMITEMKVQLDDMQAELDKEKPRIHTAKTAITELRNLNAEFGDESALEYTAQHPSYNFIYLMLFLLLLWVFYRLKVKSSKKANQS
jgi:septal ring factor EnvC (AmiA/AmiB activator)